MTWRDRAACRGTDTETFFATAPRGAHRYDHEEAARGRESAKRVCRGCPVRQPCLEWAIEHYEYGIWGGTDEDERRRMRLTGALWMPGESRFGDEHDNPAGASQ